MKRILLSAITILLAFCSTNAQTLTASTNNPVAGDVFYGYVCDTDSVHMGLAGTGVTWDFTHLTVDTTDTTRVVLCSATAFCDSFPGANLALVNTDSSTIYLATSTSAVVAWGGTEGTDVFRFQNPKTFMFYPLSFGARHADTAKLVIPSGFGPDLHLTTTDSFYCDGVGTLKLPGGATYNNVLRVHRIETMTDSIDFMGSPMVNSTTTHYYDWYVAGFHITLLTLTYDTSGSDTFLSEVKYYQKPVGVGINSYATISANVYPNPAANFVRINVAGEIPTSIIINDMMGRTVANITGAAITGREVEISTAAFADGIYTARIQTANGITLQKFTVSK